MHPVAVLVRFAHVYPATTPVTLRPGVLFDCWQPWARVSAAPPDVQDSGGFLFQHLREESAAQADMPVEDVTPREAARVF